MTVKHLQNIQSNRRSGKDSGTWFLYRSAFLLWYHCKIGLYLKPLKSPEKYTKQTALKRVRFALSYPHQTSEKWFHFKPATQTLTTRGRVTKHLHPSPCRTPIRAGGSAEIQHRLHPVHAWGAQHASHLRLDGQSSGLPSPQTSAQVFAPVCRWLLPPVQAPSGFPFSRWPGDECNSRRGAYHCQAAPEKRARCPCGWSQRERTIPWPPAGRAGDVEALVTSGEAMSAALLPHLDQLLLCIL